MGFPVLPATAAAQATRPKESLSHARSALTLPVVAEARWKECEQEYALQFFSGSVFELPWGLILGGLFSLFF